jgi:hypothetical protein
VLLDSFFKDDEESFFFFLDLLLFPEAAVAEEEVVVEDEKRGRVEGLSELTDANMPWMARASAKGSFAVAKLPPPTPPGPEAGEPIKKLEEDFSRLRIWSWRRV